MDSAIPPADRRFRKLQHTEQVAVQFEPTMPAAPAVAAMDHDRFDQRPDRVARGARLAGRKMPFEFGARRAIHRLVIGGKTDHRAFRYVGDGAL